MPRTRQTASRVNPDVERLEDLPRTVVTYARDLAAGETLPMHHHRRAQLVYASSGVMAVTTGAAAYVVPPQRAVWMPGGVEHRIDARSRVAMRTLYIEPEAVRKLPSEVCVLQVSPLLRELIVAAVTNGNEQDDVDSPQARLKAVILDQIQTQPVASLALPMPTEPRVLHITRALLRDPSDWRGLDAWAGEVGASKRTLTRLFKNQTGMSFQAWREQRRLLRALELLATGASVTAAAHELGYRNTSAFIAMFRRLLGTTPHQYLNAEKS